MTLLVDMKLEILADILDDSFSVSTLVGVSMLADRVYKGFPISLSYILMLVDLIVLDMLDFGIILGIDWLHACFASTDYRSRLFKFQFQNKPVSKWKGGNINTRGKIISYQKACKIIAKGCLYHIERVREL